MTPPFIYALVDPLEPSRYRYVGMTMTTAKRPYKHATSARHPDARNTHAFNWIRKIQSEGREPAPVLLKEFPKGTPLEDVRQSESDHIRDLKAAGHPLTNGNYGGAGSSPGRKASDATRAKLSAARKRRPPESAELCAKKRERALKQFAERPVSKETREKHRVNSIGNRYASGGKSFLGITHTVAARTKMQNAWTPERRAAQAERNREMAKWSLEERLRRSQIALDRERRIYAKAQRIGIA